MPSYVPDRGDLIWLDFDPQTGHEQAGRRPAVVLSPKSYNHRVGLALACPITSQVKGYPFEVRIREHGVDGVVLADQVRCVDWKDRRARRIGGIAETTLEEVQLRLAPLLGL